MPIGTVEVTVEADTFQVNVENPEEIVASLA